MIGGEQARPRMTPQGASTDDESSWRVYAHTPGPYGWHLLSDHLASVAANAASFAQPFGLGEMAYWLGIFHDLGKVNPEFQRYLRGAAAGMRSRVVPHAIWGAALIYNLLYKGKGDHVGWKYIALPVLGHHAGLADGGRIATDLHYSLQANSDIISLMVSYVKHLGLELPPLNIPSFSGTETEMAIRMVYSALVDADYLDTERHFEPNQYALRDRWPSLESLWARLEENQRTLIAQSPDTEVNRVRREVYERCLQEAAGPTGVYRLTVPTGGGKTRSSLAFALKHALAHDLRRVIVVIPYTTIIDQTVDVYRRILGDESVLEHHSQVEPDDDESLDPDAYRMRLAAQNWDAPVVVTTTVQLFESLFSDKPTRARKIHNLARSVIVLDEVQTLPSELLETTLDGLRFLVESCGSTLLLSTATQPVFEDSYYLKAFAGLVVREIVPDYQSHFRRLRRVEYRAHQIPLSWDILAERIRANNQVMVVLNTRKDALALFNALGEDDNTFHLSTLLCGAHRKVILSEIRRRLEEGEEVRLISTQVVEAGVDLDFPVVWRALGPLDRVVQVAGRCNREGKLEAGQVNIFEPADGRSPRGPYKVAIEKARLLLARYGPDALHEPGIFREYFRELFSTVNTDAKGIQALRKDLKYPEVAARYRLIENETTPVVVPYGPGWCRLEEWKLRPDWRSWHRLQPYVVGLYTHEVRSLEQSGWLDKVSDGVYRWLGRYDNRKGISEAQHDPSDLVC